MSTSAPRTARARARAEITAEIVTTARRHLLEHGAPNLSLRAIARDLEMVSSAIYRYFPSRDALITQLIIEAYNSMGDACERADAGADRGDLAGRWSAIAHAARRWASEHTDEYALIYGSPIPGYEAPTDTIDPAARVPLLLLQLFNDLNPDRVALPSLGPLPPGLEEQLTVLPGGPRSPVEAHALLVGVGEWSKLFGLISFELFGTFRNSFDDADELFDYQVEVGAIAMGMR